MGHPPTLKSEMWAPGPASRHDASHMAHAVSAFFHANLNRGAVSLTSKRKTIAEFGLNIGAKDAKALGVDIRRCLSICNCK